MLRYINNYHSSILAFLHILRSHLGCHPQFDVAIKVCCDLFLTDKNGDEAKVEFFSGVVSACQMAHSSNSLTLQTYPSLITIYKTQFDTKKTGFIEFDEFILVWI